MLICRLEVCTFLVVECTTDDDLPDCIVFVDDEDESEKEAEGGYEYCRSSLRQFAKEEEKYLSDRANYLSSDRSMTLHPKHKVLNFVDVPVGEDLVYKYVLFLAWTCSFLTCHIQ